MKTKNNPELVNNTKNISSVYPWILSITYQTLLIILTLIFLHINNTEFSFELIKARLGRWDGGHYITIAKKGYEHYLPPSENFNLIVFLPFHPLLINIFGQTTKDLYTSAVIITTLASIVGHALLIKYLGERLHYSKWKILRIALLFLFSESRRLPWRNRQPDRQWPLWTPWTPIHQGVRWFLTTRRHRY